MCLFCSETLQESDSLNSAGELNLLGSTQLVDLVDSTVVNNHKNSIDLTSSSTISSESPIAFSEVAQLEGINYLGESWGVAWTNFNGDKYPDLWSTNHLSLASFFLNSPDQGFTNTTSTIFPVEPTRDYHGSVWADFDNDGDQDLILQTASDNARGQTELLVNENGILLDQAEALGVATPARGRMPIWFDYNQDALLDLIIAAGAREEAPPTVFQQVIQGEQFVNANDETGFAVDSSSFSLLSDLDADDNFELIIDGGSRIFDTQTLPFQDETSDWLPLGTPNNVEDALVADFNGDLLPDLFVVRSRNDSDLVQLTPDSLRALLRANADQTGIEFSSNGNITFELPTLSLDEIYIGSNGFNPTSNRFTLSPNDLASQGMATYTPGLDRGAYIGYDTSSNTWQLFWSTPKVSSKAGSQYIFIESDAEITNASAIGFNPNDQALPEQLFLNTGTTLVDQSDAAGLSQIPTFVKNAVTADFDNDMDLDIYGVATSLAGNRKNILYENQGDGTFILHEGTANFGETLLGLGDSASTVDYDLDGFVDLFVTNGNFFLGYGNISRQYYNDAPYQLFRNQGNGNNWLQVDLQGTESNRDGIGSKIYATAGGITQLREQTGGVHNKAQSHSRIHFGLAQNTLVDHLKIKWASGIVNNHKEVSPNQLLTIVEGQGLAGDDYLIGNKSSNALFGLAGDDTLEGGSGLDTLDGGAGVDTASYSNSSAAVTISLSPGSGTAGDAEGDVLINVENIIGSDYDDSLSGNSLSNHLEGGNGNDTLIGGLGADILDGGEGTDSVNYASSTQGVTIKLGPGTGVGGEAAGDQLIGIENVIGSGEKDKLIGNRADNILDGGDGPDRLIGKGGNDTLIGGDRGDVFVGGRGVDVLTGGKGPDKFRFNSLQDGIDTILDFESGKDLILVKGSKFGGGLTKGFLAPEQFVLGATASNTNHRFIYDQGTGYLSFDADGIGGKAQQLFMILANNTSLEADNVRIV